MVNEVAVVKTELMVPSAMVGITFTVPLTAIDWLVAPVEVQVTLPEGEPLAELVIRM